MFDQSLLEGSLKSEEGDRVRRYLDTKGIWTIGIGHNLKVSPLPAGWTEPLSDAQIDTLFAHDIAKTLANLDARWPGWRDFPEPVARSIADMGYNMGVGQISPPSGLMQFNTFRALIDAGDYTGAANDLTHTLWATQVGSRATRIEALIRSVG